MFQRHSLRLVAMVAGFLLCAGARQAAAQLGTGGTSGLGTGTGGTSAVNFATEDFFVGIQAEQGVNLTTFESARFFNTARCQCDTPAFLFVSLQQSGFAKRSQIIARTGNTGQIKVFLTGGSGCTDPVVASNSTLCRQVDSESLLTFLNQGSWEIKIGARAMSTNLSNSLTTLDGGTTTGSDDPCSASHGSFFQTVQVVLYYTNSSADFSVTDSVAVDLEPPPAPTGFTVQGGNEALIGKWDQVDQSLVSDLLGYQILCDRAGQYQVFHESGNDAGGSSGDFSASFVTCPATQATTGLTGIAGLDARFVCSPLLSAIATSYRIQVLQNDITYGAAVVAIDNSGNASTPEIVYGKAIKTLSFYDVYRDGYAASNDTSSPAPGGASGGFCAVGVRRPSWRSGLVAIAGFGLGAAGLAIGRRRRRGRR